MFTYGIHAFTRSSGHSRARVRIVTLACTWRRIMRSISTAPFAGERSTWLAKRSETCTSKSDKQSESQTPNPQLLLFLSMSLCPLVLCLAPIEPDHCPGFVVICFRYLCHESRQTEPQPVCCCVALSQPVRCCVALSLWRFVFFLAPKFLFRRFLTIAHMIASCIRVCWGWPRGEGRVGRLGVGPAPQVGRLSPPPARSRRARCRSNPPPAARSAWRTTSSESAPGAGSV